MYAKVAIVYNEPVQSRYHASGEEKAEIGVLEAVNAVKKAIYELPYAVSLVPLVMPVERAEEALNSLMVDVVFNLFRRFSRLSRNRGLAPGIPFQEGDSLHRMSYGNTAAGS